MFRASILSPMLLLSCMEIAARSEPPAPAPPPPPALRPRLPIDIGIDVETHDSLFYLGAPAFQEELNLTPGTLARANELKQKMRQDLEAAASLYAERYRALILGRAGAEEFSALSREREAVLLNRQEQIESAIRGLLDTRQRIRLEELELQAIGPGAFTAPEFKEFRARMNLDAYRLEAINALAKTCGERLVRVSTPPQNYGSFTRDQRRAHWDSVQREAAQIRKSAMTAIDNVMSEEQRAAYQRLLGEPFDFSSMRAKPFG